MNGITVRLTLCAACTMWMGVKAQAQHTPSRWRPSARYLSDAANAPQKVNSTVRGKVVIIRGLFTVFSLGLDTLGDKLRRQGFDVEVTPSLMAQQATAKIRREYLASGAWSPAAQGAMPPIIFIGHSRGGQMGPACAQQLREVGIGVKLIVVVDNNHHTTVPDNVERCVNFYQTNYLGIFRGLPMQADSPSTQIVNVNIDELNDRGQGGFITHLNIDESTWLHDKIIAEVVRAARTVAPSTRVSKLWGTGTLRRDGIKMRR